MNEYKAFALIIKEIDRSRNDQIIHLSSGRAESYEDYAKICGVIRGLSLAEEMINNLVRKMENSDE